MDDIENALDKILEAAKDGQSGSAAHALGRLSLIRQLAENWRELANAKLAAAGRPNTKET